MRQFDDDYEIDAIDKCSRALSKLDDRTKIRVIRFLLDKFGLIAQTEQVVKPEKNDTVSQNIHYQQNNLVLVEPEKLPGITSASHAFIDGNVIAIKDVLIKGLTKTEPELILIISLYNSSFGKHTFSRQSILDSYRDNGVMTELRRKNLSGNLSSLIKKSYLSTITEEELAITPEGIEHAKNVLSGNSTTKKRKPRVKKYKSSKISIPEEDEQAETSDEINEDEES